MVHVSEKCKLTNMCLLKVDSKILVQMRKAKDWPGLTLPGGHVEKNESLKEAMIREFREETGLVLIDPVLCGIEEYKNNPATEDRYLIFFYIAHKAQGKLKSSSEGEVFWIEEKDLDNYSLSLNIKEIIQLMQDPNLSCLRYFKSAGEWNYVLE